MIPEQIQAIRELYAQTLAVGNGEESMPLWAATTLADQEPLDTMLEQLDGHPELHNILGDDD